MKKKYDYKEISSKNCIDCNKPLKLNLVSKSSYANRCYCCYQIFIGKLTSIRNRYNNGIVINTKILNYKEIQKLNIKTWRN